MLNENDDLRHTLDDVTVMHGIIQGAVRYGPPGHIGSGHRELLSSMEKIHELHRFYKKLVCRLSQDYVDIHLLAKVGIHVVGIQPHGFCDMECLDWLLRPGTGTGLKQVELINIGEESLQRYREDNCGGDGLEHGRSPPLGFNTEYWSNVFDVDFDISA